MNETNGGPAFPSYPANAQNKGMTLRDWFAGQALMGMLAHENKSYNTPEVLAEVSYKLADAMLLHKKEKP